MAKDRLVVSGPVTQCLSISVCQFGERDTRLADFYVLNQPFHFRSRQRNRPRSVCCFRSLCDLYGGQHQDGDQGFRDSHHKSFSPEI
jgi:hypothetical protein